ncbi:MAG: hypothetical protein K8T89_14580 [Planctomycetes bacterium]|nr:hypothetical protein [Planctomycetota bacterium]
MMNRRDFFFLGLQAGSLILCTGCGSGNPKKISVTGRISYRGEPLHGGMIVFVPDEERGNAGPLVKGSIESDGSYLLGNDVKAGWYRVSIAPQVSAGTSYPSAAEPYPGPPAKYRNPQLSGLKGEVRPNSENVLNFQLEDA